MNKSLPLLAILLLQFTTAVRAQPPLLDPKTQPQFVNPLPVPSVIDARNGGSFRVSITQFSQNLGLVDPLTQAPLLTTVWGYNGTYPGPTILARKDRPISILWENKLLKNGKPLPHLLPVDASIHWALMDEPDQASLGVPVVTHLHGGHTESASDGLPEAWFTPDFAKQGRQFVKRTYDYSNDQEAATIWYHDHAIGLTRLNVYAGLAGFYLVTDDNEAGLQSRNQLPAAPYDIGLAIQDRMFTADGQLYYPTMPPSAGTPENSVMPEFFGNTILVNGKAWPVLDVEPRAYRFRLLNGSDSRFYNLTLSSGQSFVQIGSDNGLLPEPLSLRKVLIAPGERKDVVIDFSDPSLWGKTVIVQNNAKTPYPSGSVVDPATTGRIMAFRIVKPLDKNIPATVLPATLRPPIARLSTTLSPRKLILFEATDGYGRLMPMLGTVGRGVLGFHEPVTEEVRQNDTEVWEIYNETVDAHPIHLHMVTMQLVNRQKFNASVDMVSGAPTNIRMVGQPLPPTAEEAGWKDTYVAYPGEVLRVIAKFDVAGLYAWHCHILSHEDNEMMRPYRVVANDVSSAADRAVGEDKAPDNSFGISVVPNPSRNRFTVQFTLPQPAAAGVTVYDSKGSIMKKITLSKGESGKRQVEITADDWSSGVYFCELRIGGKTYVRRVVLEK